jgi:hypothetical protein
MTFRKTGLFTLTLLLTLSASLQAATFQLQAVLSKENYGPFAFKPQHLVKVESGVYRLNVLTGRSFKLNDTDSDKIYGVYELVPGRIIDIGDTLYTVNTIKATTPQGHASQAASHTKNAAPSIWNKTAMAIEVELLDSVKYDWEIDGASGESEEKLDRTSASLNFQKNHIYARVGLVTSAHWDNTIAGDGDTFENVTLEEGTGWFVGLGVGIPIFQEGRWSADIFGEAFYRKETLSLQYGAWEVASIVSTTVTNGASNVVMTTTNLDYNNYDEEATLTEMLVVIGATVAYEAPSWFLYAGLKALPWSDTSLDAAIVVSDKKHKIEFERNDPVMAYGGIGFIIATTKCYLEVEGGGETAVRLGLLKEL